MPHHASRISYTLNEIATMRSMSKQAIIDDMMHGQLKVHIWLPMMVVEHFKEHHIGDKVLFERSEDTYEGYVRVYAKDIRKLFRLRKMALRSFPCEEDNCEIVLKRGTPDIMISRSDLVILKESLSHLKLTSPNPQGLRVKSIQKLDDVLQTLYKQNRRPAHIITYDTHFQNVTFGEYVYSFGMLQASIVKQLFQASSNNSPKIHFKILLEKSGAQSMAIRDVFKSQPDWKHLICHDNRGYYWLHPDFMNEMTVEQSMAASV
jgi:hypothetical protein